MTWIVNSIALILVVNFIPGIHSDHWSTSAVAALTLGIMNAFVKPVIILLTLPINVLSLGFFTLFINGFLLYLVSKFVIGFTIVNFSSAVFGALLFSVLTSLLGLVINPKGKVNFRFYNYSSRSSSRRDNTIDVEGKSKDDELPPRT